MQAFNAARYKQDYPQFANLSDQLLTNTYNYAAKAKFQWVYTYFDDKDQQYYWACIVLTHVLTLQYGADGTGSSGIVGRISQATEGSISVSTDYNVGTKDGAAWWNQTQWGAMVWSVWCEHGVFTYVSEASTYG